MVSDEIQGSSRRFGRVHVLRVTFFGASIDCLSRHVAKPPLLWGNGTMQVEASPFFWVILLMEKKLHHLGCSKCWFYTSIKTFGASQVAQDFFHQPYDLELGPQENC